MSAIYEIPVGQLDRIEVDWEDALDELPAGAAINVIAHAFDGGDGGMALSNSTFSAKVSSVNISASGGTEGFYYLKVTMTSNASPDNFVVIRWLPVRLVTKMFVDEV